MIPRQVEALPRRLGAAEKGGKVGVGDPSQEQDLQIRGIVAGRFGGDVEPAIVGLVEQTRGQVGVFQLGPRRSWTICGWSSIPWT